MAVILVIIFLILTVIAINAKNDLRNTINCQRYPSEQITQVCGTANEYDLPYFF